MKHLRSIKLFSWTILVVLFFQLIYGALMAGHKAANVAATWPTINGQWIPAGLTSKDSFLLNAVNNTIWIHFIHRGLAYLLLILIVWYSNKLFRINGNAFWNLMRRMPLTFVLFQVALGIFTVISSAKIVPGVWAGFEWMAQLHQLVGMLLLLSVVNIIYVTKD